jgi:hypothetical protein
MIFETSFSLLQRILRMAKNKSLRGRTMGRK